MSYGGGACQFQGMNQILGHNFSASWLNLDSIASDVDANIPKLTLPWFRLILQVKLVEQWV